MKTSFFNSTCSGKFSDGSSLIIDFATEKAEALLPVAASDIIKNKEGIVKFFTSSENWFGMTYPEDREIVKAEIAKKIKDGYYPEILWEK